MTVHRFYIEQVTPTDNKIILSGEVSRQISKVLRLAIGDIVVVFDKEKIEYTLMLERVSKDAAVGRMIKQEKNSAEPTILIHLYQSLLPREKFEDVLQLNTQMGVSAFFPIETVRTIVKTKDIKEEKIQRWQKIIQEASEQSERGVVPVVHPSQKFEQAVEQASRNGVVLIAWEEEANNHPSDILSKIKNYVQQHVIPAKAGIQKGIDPLSESRMTISIFIGPEGGFEKSEIDLATSKGAKTISLGKRILKSETAGIVLSSLVLFSVGDLDTTK